MLDMFCTQGPVIADVQIKNTAFTVKSTGLVKILLVVLVLLKYWDINLCFIFYFLFTPD